MKTKEITRTTVYLPTKLYLLAKKKHLKISPFLVDQLNDFLEVPDCETELLQELEEIKKHEIIVNLKLQDIKLKKGLSFDEFIDNIQNSDSYADKRKEAIISDLIDAMQTIKRNPAFVSGQQSRIYRKHDINIKPDQLRKWANEKQEMKL